MVTRDRAMNCPMSEHVPFHSARLLGLQILALVFTSCVTLGKLRNTSEGFVRSGMRTMQITTQLCHPVLGKVSGTEYVKDCGL